MTRKKTLGNILAVEQSSRSTPRELFVYFTLRKVHQVRYLGMGVTFYSRVFGSVKLNIMNMISIKMKMYSFVSFLFGMHRVLPPLTKFYTSKGHRKQFIGMKQNRFALA